MFVSRLDGVNFSPSFWGEAAVLRFSAPNGECVPEAIHRVLLPRRGPSPGGAAGGRDAHGVPHPTFAPEEIVKPQPASAPRRGRRWPIV